MVAAIIIGSILVVALTVATSVAVLGKKPAFMSNGFLGWVHDLFSFKKLYLEDMLKVLYIFLTFLGIIGGIVCIICGICSYNEYYYYYYEYGSGYADEEYLILMWTYFGSAIGLLISPVITRLAYEVTMIFVNLAKDVKELKNKQ